MEVVEETQLLTKLAKTVALEAERAGVKLADLEPLLLFAEENGLVGLLGDLNDELPPLLPLLVRLARWAFRSCRLAPASARSTSCSPSRPSAAPSS